MVINDDNVSEVGKDDLNVVMRLVVNVFLVHLVLELVCTDKDY